MCSGNIIIHSCGHESARYYHTCDDARNEHRQALLPHRMVGRRLRSARLCMDCQMGRAAGERSEERRRSVDEERAKAVLEFLRGERPWPRPDDEIRVNFVNAYFEQTRLHPWLNHGHEAGRDAYRATLIDHLLATGAALFQELLDRQAEIDQTGIILPSDAELRHRITSTLLAAAEASRRRQAEQARLPQATQAMDRIRDLQLSLYHPGAINDSLSGQHIAAEVEGVREVDQANLEILIGIAELIEQTGTAPRPSDQGMSHTGEVPRDAGQDEAREYGNTVIQNDEVELRLYTSLGLLRESLVEAIRATEHTLRERNQAVRGIGEVEGAPGDLESGPQSLRASERLSELHLLRTEIIQELRDGSQNLEEPRQRELSIQQQVAAPGEQLNSLGESDPSWLLNFDDWSTENGGGGTFSVAEVDLRRDMNGWFQHLRTCESQARLEWIPYAEAYRDAVLAGSRWSYEYTPSFPDETGWLPLSFRNWCLQEADPAEIRMSPINSVFINLLEGYMAYLRSNESLGDAHGFISDRSRRVNIIRDHLAAIPGSPLSRNRSTLSTTTEDTSSNVQMRMDIRRLLIEGGLTTVVRIQEHPAQFGNLDNPIVVAHRVDESRLLGSGIENDDGAARARREEAERIRWEREADTDYDE